MCKLNYEELILLDNLIYILLDAKENEELISVVNRLLSNGNFDHMENCSLRMTKEEWINILIQIKNKPNLKKMRINNVDNYKKNIRFACFVDERENAVVVFRGTATEGEWEDNGQGAYEYDTREQIDSLNYINNLKFKNLIVTGHSKGGNKAQYVTILSDKIDKCISINGQGFSNEFISKYRNEIEKSKSKIICINSKYDYVYCLFNQIGGTYYYIETELQINPLDYHKLNILLDENGYLRKGTNEGILSEIINNFSIYLISELPKDIRSLVIDVIIDAVELILCRGKKGNNIIQDAGETLIMCCYENYFTHIEIFDKAYIVMEAILLPLIFWSEIIKVKETNSKQLFNEVINGINIVKDGIIKKLEIIDKDSQNLLSSISKAIEILISELKMKILK